MAAHGEEALAAAPGLEALGAVAALAVAPELEALGAVVALEPDGEAEDRRMRRL